MTPHAPKVHMEFSFLYIKNRQLEKAIVAAQRAIELDAAYSDAYYALGVACKGTQRFNESLESINRHIDLCQRFGNGKPPHQLLYYDRGEIHLALGNMQASLADFLLARQLYPSSAVAPNAAYGAWRVYTHKRQNVIALVLVDDIVCMEPKSEFAHSLRGWSLLRLGRENESLASFRQGITLDPTGIDSNNGLARLYLKSGEHRNAMHHADVALANEPEDAERLHIKWLILVGSPDAMLRNGNEALNW